MFPHSSSSLRAFGRGGAHRIGSSSPNVYWGLSRILAKYMYSLTSLLNLSTETLRYLLRDSTLDDSLNFGSRHDNCLYFTLLPMFLTDPSFKTDEAVRKKVSISIPDALIGERVMRQIFQ